MAAGRPPKFDETKVLERAMDFFWEHGYKGGGISDLLVHAGVGRQTLYSLYGSKRGLFLKVIEYYRTTQLGSVIELLNREESPMENVIASVRFFKGLAADKRCRGCLVANALVEIGDSDREITALLEETLESLEKAVCKALRRAKAQGELAVEKDPKSLSRALTNAMIGMAVTGRLGKRRAALADIYEGTIAMLA